MDDDVTRILTLAGDYPGLGIDAVRARQIATECADLRQACDAAMHRFSACEVRHFDALFMRPAAGATPE